jgi:hypothetical protein
MKKGLFLAITLGAVLMTIGCDWSSCCKKADDKTETAKGKKDAKDKDAKSASKDQAAMD